MNADEESTTTVSSFDREDDQFCSFPPMQPHQDGVRDEDDSNSATDPSAYHSSDKITKCNYKNWRVQVTEGFMSLRNSPPELYKVLFLKFLDAYSYHSFTSILTLFLSDDFGYSDIKAGTIYGGYGAMITVFGLCTGFLVDNFGVSKSLKLGYCLSLLARCGIFLTTSRTMLLVLVYGTLPLGNCLGIPVLVTAIRRYTHKKNRGFAFGIFYTFWGLGVLFSGPVVDVLTIWYKGGVYEGGKGEQANGWSLSSYRAIILTGIIANAFACCISLSVREIKIETEVTATGSTTTGNVTVFRPKTGTAWEILRETCKSPSFRRYLFVMIIMLNVRSILRHLDATWPKYMVREFGPDIPKGTIHTINPTLVVILVPIVTALTTQIDPLVMMHIGSYVSAISVFFLAFSTAIWSSCVFVVLLSLGEVIWGPRINDFTMSICEEGREGTYLALGTAPVFLSKLPTGVLSGMLLQKYCPESLEDGQERHSQLMWLIVGMISATSPILLTCCWGYVSKKDAEDDIQDDIKYTELPKIRPSITESP